MNRLPIEELRKLLSQVSDHGVQHLTAVEADLLQTQFLLTEAIEKLSVSFENIHQNISQQQIVLDELTQQYEFSDDNPLRQHLETLKMEVGDNVGAVVTGMQFQDMTSQLLVRSLQRLAGIKEMLGAFGTDANPSPADVADKDEEVLTYIEDLNTALNMKSHEITGGFKQRPVSQKDLTTGDIELF